MKHFCTLAMTRATELFQIVSEKSRVSLQGTVCFQMHSGCNLQFLQSAADFYSQIGKFYAQTLQLFTSTADANTCNSCNYRNSAIIRRPRI